jgi:protein-S-isoprenylcysteine O-methyltransferase Ste14
MSDFGWGTYLAIAALLGAGNLWLYHQRTQPERELGLLGSLSVTVLDLYVIVGMTLGAIYRPFGMWLTGGWMIATMAIGLAVAMAGAAVLLWGMVGFRSLPRTWALEENRLVTSGIYAHVRHPQFAGAITAAFGVAIAFETLVGLLLAVGALLWSLVQTRLEDQRLIVLFGDQAQHYIAAVPALVPRRTAHRDPARWKRPPL